MAERGVAGLSLSEVARRVGIRQPSLYKHFASLNAVYDELFREGAEQQLDVVVRAAKASSPGLPALTAAIEALGRLAVANPVAGQLIAWRPVPGFEPSPEAFRPSVELVEVVSGLLRDAVAHGHLAPGAGSEEGTALLSIVVTGTLSQQMANEPGVPYETGRFTSRMSQAIAMFAEFYKPGRQEE